MNNPNKNKIDIAIIGQGPTGLIAALALAKQTEFTIAIFGPKPTQSSIQKDTRTTAFMIPSLTMLDKLGLWQKTKHNAAPLKHLRMIDDCQTLLRAPDCFFSAKEVGLDAFAQNIANTDLNQALLDAIDNTPNVTWVETAAVTKVSPSETCIDLETKEGDGWQAYLVVGADGRNSICRAAAKNIEETIWSYDQTAIACSITHDMPHDATSIELHRPSGPLTLIPLKENHASIVWSLKPEVAKQIVELNDEEFCDQLFQATYAMWGNITSASKRVAFPISAMRLNKFAANRIFLIGEAAHVAPPIGAQGLNLGLRDIAHIVDVISEFKDLNQDLSSLEADYNQRRKGDIWSRTTAIDILNKSLLVSFMPLKLLRSTGLNLLNKSKFLRQQLINLGLGESENLPSLMQREKLDA